MITVPESVFAYFTQPAIQTAVDLLLTRKEPKIPGNLTWNEVSSFYRASLAARQVPTEFAMFTEQLWREIWTDVPTCWRPIPPSKPARPDLAVGVSTVWDQGCFSRRFECSAYALELSAGLWLDTGLQLGVLLYDKQENVPLRKEDLVGWAQENGTDTFWTQDGAGSLSKVIAPADFRGLAKQALDAVATVFPGG